MSTDEENFIKLRDAFKAELDHVRQKLTELHAREEELMSLLGPTEEQVFNVAKRKRTNSFETTNRCNELAQFIKEHPGAIRLDIDRFIQSRTPDVKRSYVTNLLSAGKRRGLIHNVKHSNNQMLTRWYAGPAEEGTQ